LLDIQAIRSQAETFPITGVFQIANLFSILANSSAERCLLDDLVPNVHVSCLPPSCVDPELYALRIIIIVLSQVVRRCPKDLLELKVHYVNNDRGPMLIIYGIACQCMLLVVVIVVNDETGTDTINVSLCPYFRYNVVNSVSVNSF